jgi:hypothetical protein
MYVGNQIPALKKCIQEERLAQLQDTIEERMEIALDLIEG